MDYDSLRLRLKMAILDNAVKEYQKDKKTIYVVIKEGNHFDEIMDKVMKVLKETGGI